MAGRGGTRVYNGVRVCAVACATNAPKQSARRCPPHVNDAASGCGCSPDAIHSRPSCGGRVIRSLRSCTFAAQRASITGAIGN